MNTSDKTAPQNDADYVKKMKARYKEAYVRMLMEESVWLEEDEQNTDKEERGDPDTKLQGG